MARKYDKIKWLAQATAQDRYIDNIVQHSYNLTVCEHKTTLMEDKDMPRVNLAITQELYDQIEKAAKKENVTVNYYICDMLEERFGKRTVYDYTLAINNMIAEAKTMKAEFVLADLPTFAGVNDVLIEYDIKESPAQVRSRLGKMFTEAVKKGNAKGIERAVIERNGVEEFKSASRAAVYCNKLYKQKKNSK